MKRIFNLFAIIAVLFTAQSCTTVDSADIGMKVDQFASDTKGEPIVVPVQGFVFYNPFVTDIHTWPGYVQHKVWTKDPQEDSPIDESINVTTKDGGRFSLDVGFNYQIDRSQAAGLFKKYRLDLTQIVNTRIRNIVRQSLTDVANSYRADSLLQYRASYEAAAAKNLTDKLDKEGFDVTAFTILDMRAPESYAQAIETKIKIQQSTLQAQANLAKVQADANAQVAKSEGYARSLIVEAEAEAKANMLKQRALTPELLRQQWIDKWNGALPTTMTGSGTDLILSK